MDRLDSSIAQAEREADCATTQLELSQRTSQAALDGVQLRVDLPSASGPSPGARAPELGGCRSRPEPPGRRSTTFGTCATELSAARSQRAPPLDVLSRSRSQAALDGRGSSGACAYLRRIHLVDPPQLDAAVSALIEHGEREQRRALRQSMYSNRFKGSARLESAYQQFTTELQLRKVQRRLFLCGAVLSYEALFVLCAPEHARSPLLLKATHGLIPCALVLCAAALLSSARLRRFWRPIVMCAAVGSFNLVTFTMLPIAADASADGIADAEEVALYQLAWLLIYQTALALNSALDFLLIALTCAALHGCFWLLLAAQCGALGEAGAWIAGGTEMRCAREPTTKVLGLASVGGVLLLFGARRINRFERLSFVRSVFQQRTLDERAGLIAGERIELLGIFANPTLTKRQQRELGLQPLRLGQELKFLVRAIPRVHLELVPAATFDDARASVLRYAPRIVMFSGHTFAQPLGVSALAFEQDNSRVDLQSSPEQFVAMLAEAHDMPGCRLECVFLNACLTLPLALVAVRQLPQLQLICWASITEDSAARYFSSGFADAIGDDLKDSRTQPDVRRAFQRGCEVFRSVGCRFGDPVRRLRRRAMPRARAARHATRARSRARCPAPPTRAPATLPRRGRDDAARAGRRATPHVLAHERRRPRLAVGRCGERPRRRGD